MQLPSPRGSVRLGLQLYSVRDAMARDPEDTLRRVREAGYRSVEWFPAPEPIGLHWSRSPETWRGLLQSLDLEVVSVHVPWDRLIGAQLSGELDTSLEPLLDELACFEPEVVVCPWLPPELRGDTGTDHGSARATDDGWRRVGEALDLVSYQLRASGLFLAYHHHDFELRPAGDGQETSATGLDLLLDCASHDGFGVEPDVFWAAWAGHDPAALLRELGTVPGRVRLVHLKDGLLPPEPEREAYDYESTPFRPLGEGQLDLDAALRAALEVGCRDLIVEQDFSEGSSLDAAERSLRWLQGHPLLSRDAATGESGP